MRRTWVGIVLGLIGCGTGGAVSSGMVSGHPAPIGETVWAPLTDSSGAAVGGLIVMSDQPSTCSLLGARVLPASATFVVFAFFRDGAPRLLAPAPGEFPVAWGPASSWSQPVFLRTDANGTLAIPEANRWAESGLLTVTALAAGGDASGHFDMKFGTQGDALRGSFSATPCTLDRAAFVMGAINRSMERRPLPLAATLPPLGPRPNQTQFWKVDFSNVVFGDLCSDDAAFRSANPPPALNSYVVYRGSADATQATLMSCTTLDPSSCTPSPSGVVFNVSGGELTFTNEVKSPAGRGACNLRQQKEWLFIDRGNVLNATVTTVLSLVDDATECPMLEAEWKARAPNGRGLEGCRIMLLLSGRPDER